MSHTLAERVWIKDAHGLTKYLGFKSALVCLQTRQSICTLLLLCRLRHLCPEAAEAHVHLPVCSVRLDSHDSAGGLYSFQLLCQQHL